MGWKISLIVTLVFFTTIALALAYGNRRWGNATTSLLNDLNTARLPNEVTTYNIEELDGLPAPVQRYFRKVLSDGQRMISAVKLEQEGTFNLDDSSDKWSPFTAVQHVATAQPGFVWDARIAMIPGVSVRVHDAYVKNEGILHASLFGLFTVAKMRGTPDAAEGEFIRFFAETAWFPTALLPSQGLQWEAIDNSSAKATLQDGDTTATLIFQFNNNDLIESVRSESRVRAVGDQLIPTPWEGRWSNYAKHDGILVPQEGEVSWLLPEAGLKPYWRGRVTDISFEFAE